MGKQEYPPESAKGISLHGEQVLALNSYRKEDERLGDVLERLVLWAFNEEWL